MRVLSWLRGVQALTPLEARRALDRIGTVDGPQQPGSRVIYAEADAKKVAIRLTKARLLKWLRA